MILLWRILMTLALPILALLLLARAARGKEDRDRMGERMGIPGRQRPPGRLVWLHAASVGEAMSALELVGRLCAQGPVLVTTGTVTSARLMQARLPSGAIHQFIPLDRPAWVARFLDHWRPDAALWIESELWPTLLTELGRRGIPAALVNGRISHRSARRWGLLPGTIGQLLGQFRLILPQAPADAARFKALGARHLAQAGNLKFSAPVLPHDAAGLAQARGHVAGRPLWLAASTHPGEEARIARIHRLLAPTRSGLLTLIIPRHPHRGAAIAAELSEFRLARRSAGEAPQADTEIWLCDTLGEMGLFYRLAPIVLMGGSLVAHGGHNPIEPAQLGAALVFGPHMQNFQAIAGALEDAGGAIHAMDDEQVAAAIGRLLDDAAARAALAQAALSLAESNRAVIDAVLAALAPVLAPKLEAAA